MMAFLQHIKGLYERAAGARTNLNALHGFPLEPQSEVSQDADSS